MYRGLVGSQPPPLTAEVNSGNSILMSRYHLIGLQIITPLYYVIVCMLLGLARLIWLFSTVPLTLVYTLEQVKKLPLVILCSVLSEIILLIFKITL